ncbi:MAG: GTP cyclohydrolase I FolE [Hyphomicrobiales bacterium]|jgi:GTP cyclohydrolase I|nr:GTP cyclohydrolase I FolE [Hyphomicrobiales bacterium]MDG1523419.1 GTP cyclohydrolase I FolE [Hyphomicrobiales bacterium]MDG1665361.1 GTP cyclohydrolase I FolE [Hyphomicrobiales bacterium]|tara:strand:+ start:15 stop:638 length:624 start_codon:yes stop_codon:yes gene_type:complete
MDVKVSDRAIHTESNDEELKKPSREEAMDAVRTLISWAGDDPEREGLIETPKRVVKAYEEFFAGYAQDPVKVLGKTFEDVKGYDDIVFLRDINIETHCEHHMVPILGKAHVAYLPKNKVVGISKLARVIEIFAKRLQTQETMTMQILNTIDDTLDPYGTAIMIDAKHQCMTTRGINKPNVSTVTTKFSGSFSNDTDLRQRFMQLTKG